MKTEQRRKKEGAGSICILAAGILWAAQGLFVRRLSVYGFDAIQIVTLRFFVAALGCGLVSLLKEPSCFRVPLKELPLLFAIGTGSMAVVSVTYYAALRMMDMSVASILMYTSPIWVTMISALVFHEKITRRKTTALFLAFGGCVLVSGGSGHVTVPGIILGLTSGVFYGLYSILGSIALRKHPPLRITTYGFLFAAIGLFLLSKPRELLRIISAAQEKLLLVLLVLGLGILTTIAPYFLYTLGLKTTQASKAAILATVEPMMVTVFGAVFYRETLTAGAAVGIAGILAAVLMLNRKGKESG